MGIPIRAQQRSRFVQGYPSSRDIERRDTRGEPAREDAIEEGSVFAESHGRHLTHVSLELARWSHDRTVTDRSGPQIPRAIAITQEQYLIGPRYPAGTAGCNQSGLYPLV